VSVTTVSEISFNSIIIHGGVAEILRGLCSSFLFQETAGEINVSVESVCLVSLPIKIFRVFEQIMAPALCRIQLTLNWK
jgi:hypothetical protein